ncbi:MAG: hypothetical protein OEZ36_06200 [Spirochaetota bacterium]|nr:hypothetical protein [Spirochaetota bacterium]
MEKITNIDDILVFTDKGIQTFLREVDGEDLTIALKNVDKSVEEKIIKNMSRRASKLLKEDMDSINPSSDDINLAQEKIMIIIQNLLDKKEIPFDEN